MAGNLLNQLFRGGSGAFGKPVRTNSHIRARSHGPCTHRWDGEGQGLQRCRLAFKWKGGRRCWNLGSGKWETEMVCPCRHGRKLCKHLADEDSPWTHALNSCRETGLPCPKGKDTQRGGSDRGGTWAGKERRRQGSDGVHRGEEMRTDDKTKGKVSFPFCFSFSLNTSALKGFAIMSCFFFFYALNSFIWNTDLQ